MLRAALQFDVPAGLDPHRENYNVSSGLFRCCLLRALMAYPGTEADSGGLHPQPDLAAAPPEVSADGLTWTFRLRQGIRYAPPHEEREIQAADVVRALERELDPDTLAGHAYHFSVIRGADAFADGEADAISGLRTPDPYTLEIELTRPIGHLGNLFALAGTAPLPEGLAEAHPEDLGRFLAASGPYMFEGAGEVDPSAPPEQQEPPTGYIPGRSIVLVRNPSWDASTDPLRPAYPDRIEIEIGGTLADLENKVTAGELDVIIDGNSSPAIASSYSEDPELRSRVFVEPSDSVLYVLMNTAAPPFDDVHVRRAVNLALDRPALVRVSGGQFAGEVLDHVTPDGFTSGALADFDPFGSPDDGPDIARAMEEMALSKYDSDGDGLCDAEACREVIAPAPNDPISEDRSAVIGGNLEEIGISLLVRPLDFGALIDLIGSPAERVPIALWIGWLGEFPNAETFLRPFFSGASILDTFNTNFSLLGARPEQLGAWGYGTTDVPNVDDRIEVCIPLTLDEQERCWAELDRYLMEEIVPIAPIMSYTLTRTVSDRVRSFSVDAANLVPALDRISLEAAEDG